MKTKIITKLIITLSFCFFTVFTNAQDASVEKSTFGIQTGFMGIWAHHELKLTNKITLRQEIGLDGKFYYINNYTENVFLMPPVITLEPRWYYNLSKRLSELKNISGNSGNFLSIKTSYIPDWFVISACENIYVIDQISIIPSWGIKRNIGNHFTYEMGIGFGLRYIFAKNVGYLENKSQSAGNLHLRVGYRF